MKELSDEELIARFRSAGASPAANRWIDELFRRYHGRVALWCYRHSGDRESAADLAQDVFLRAYRNLASFRGDSKFSTWLFTITRNQCLNDFRARAVRPELVAESLEDRELADTVKGSIVETMEREEALRLMRELIARTLDETERKVMTLHVTDEMQLDAITRLLELKNPSGARAYLLSARRKLAAAVGRGKQNRGEGHA